MFRSITSALIIAFGCAALPAKADVLQGQPWTVEPDFENEDARLELSGAACAGSDNSRMWCLAVNDEKKYAQFFSVLDRMIRPSGQIRLLPKEENGEKLSEVDAEGAAYDRGFVYVTGSHGLSRRGGKFRRSQFFTFRFPVDDVTGEPALEISKDQLAPEIERSDKLRQAIQRSARVGPFAERRLDVNGANIEGLAVVDGRMFFGFRGPSTDETAFLLEVPADALFAGKKMQATTHELKLGYGTGIRDLARVDGGLLVLSGDVNDVEIAPNVFFWNLETGEVSGLGQLPTIPDAKAETILVLDESTNADKTNYRVLIIYDGLENGGPTEYVVSRQQSQ